jgi:hypothetical protein
VVQRVTGLNHQSKVERMKHQRRAAELSNSTAGLTHTARVRVIQQACETGEFLSKSLCEIAV